MKKKYVAICYDFDGTLSPGNMQEYGFFSSLGKDAKNFWKESAEIAKNNHADPILSYMHLMIQKAKIGNIGTHQKDFRSYGKDVKLFNGVSEWFDRIDAYGKKHGLIIEHYIVSSGLKEIIEGTSIAKKFKKIYACSFLYDNNHAAEWPAYAVNYTSKTQFVFRINKGIQDDSDDKKINEYTPEIDRRIPFAQMIYLGDGTTDVPCMKLVKAQGGTSIAVYEPGSRKKQQAAMALLGANRVNYVLPADYSEGKDLDSLLKLLLERISIELRASEFQRKIKHSKTKQANCENCTLLQHLNGTAVPNEGISSVPSESEEKNE